MIHKDGLAGRYDRPACIFLILFSLFGSAHAAETPPYLSELLQEAHAKQLSGQRYWRLLLHDRRNLLGRYESEVDDPAFFASPRGRRDPSAELDATLEAFFEPVPTDEEQQQAQCRYPARYAWLKERLHFDTTRLPERPCPRFEKWRDQMHAESVTMVFASYYLNNPASMYGHTLLRLNGKGNKNPLLDYVVNFAAYPNTHNGILYTVRGLTGGYPGKFSTMPYYMKVQEYNNLDSRDLWEYGLALPPASVDRLVQHLWELGPASMAYYFLNKNCSYQMLPVLEVAQPSLRLSDSFWFKAIPVDTLRKVITQPGLLTGVRRRPSHVSHMLAARDQLSPDEVRAAEHLARRADAPALTELAALPRGRQARVLDSAYDLFRYRIGFDREQPPENQEQERKLLLARSQLGLDEPAAIPGPAQKEDHANSPDRGHPTGRVAGSFGWTKHSTFEELSLRSALHDQLDTQTGYIAGSQLEMFHLRLRYDNDRRTAYVQDFTLIDIMSLSPWDRWVRKPSWHVHTGLSVASDLDKDPENSLYYGLRLGPGLSYRTHLLRSELFYALAELDGGLGQVFKDSGRLGGGTTSGVIVEAASWWRIQFNAAYFKYPVGETGEAVKLQLIQAIPVGRTMQFRATLERQNAYKEVLFTFLKYL